MIPVITNEQIKDPLSVLIIVITVLRPAKLVIHVQTSPFSLSHRDL